MPFGLSNDTVEQVQFVLARHPEVRQAILYGSRAMGTHHDGSDIDLALTGKTLDLTSLSRIETELDDLLLPYEFDLSIRRQINNDSLLNHIERVGILFYDRERGSAGDHQGVARTKKGWELKPFESCIAPVEYTRKIQRKDFLGEGRFPIVSQESAFINGYWNDEADVFKVSTPVVIFGDHTQVLKYVDFDFVLGADGVKILQPREFLHPKYFYYQLQAAEMPPLGYARHYRLLKEMEIAVPPLPEQRRIVGILDEAFAGIATAKVNAEKNLQNARALFEGYLQSVFIQRGKGWVETTLGEATGGVFTGPFGSLLHKSDYVENGIPLVNPAHITEVGIEPDLRKTVSKETAKRLSNYIMHEGDIVIARRGEMGRCALVTEVEDGWLCGTGSFFIKPSNQCHSGYLVRFLRSKGCKQRLEKIAGGAVMPNLSNTDLGNLSFDLPPLVRQKEILQSIEELHAETQRLESIYQQKLVALEALKKSLLNQAFSGKL